MFYLDCLDLLSRFAFFGRIHVAAGKQTLPLAGHPLHELVIVTCLINYLSMTVVTPLIFPAAININLAIGSLIY